MTKKLNWLDQFAKEQFAKINKTASLTKKAEQAVVDAEALPTTEQGATVQFNGETYKVVDASYSDEKGPGVLIEKVAAYEGLETDPMGLSMGENPAGLATPSAAPGQEYHRTKLDIQQTYDNDQDAQWGSDSAAATAQEIAGEDAVDRTNVPGHYTKSPGLNTGMGAGLENTNVNPQTPGIVTDDTQPEGDIGTETTTDINEQSNFAPASPTGDVVAPAATEVPVEEPVAPAVEVAEETPTEEVPAEGAETEENTEEKEDKLASNRILARIFNSRK